MRPRGPAPQRDARAAQASYQHFHHQLIRPVDCSSYSQIGFGQKPDRLCHPPRPQTPGLLEQLAEPGMSSPSMPSIRAASALVPGVSAVQAEHPLVAAVQAG